MTARSFCRSCCALLITGVFSGGVSAQVLPDPTRPPDAVFTPVAQQSNINRSSGLQSVIISPTRHTAIINGQAVELGGMLGDARLIEVNESYVVLRSAEGKQVLSMFESVNLKKSVPASAGAGAAKHKLNRSRSGGKRVRQIKPEKSNGGDGK